MLKARLLELRTLLGADAERMASAVARRTQGDGSLFYDEDRDRWRGYLTVDGKRHYVSGITKRQANDKLKDLQERVSRGSLSRGNVTLAAFGDHWLETEVRDNLKPSTYRSYRQQWLNHIKPALGHHKLHNLSPAHVRAFLHAKRTQPSPVSGKVLSARTVQMLQTVLQTILNDAKRMELVDRNVVELTLPVTVEEIEVVPYTLEEVRKIITAARGDRYEAVFVVLVLTGLRPGEALGLRWMDIDFERQRIYVRGQLRRGYDRKLEYASTKTRLQRAVAMPPQVVEALVGHRERMQAEVRDQPEAFVFVSRNGQPLSKRNIMDTWERIVRLAGVPRKRMYDLRHTAASLMGYAGGDLHLVGRALGHTSPNTTQRYRHYFADEQGRLAQALGQALSGGE